MLQGGGDGRDSIPVILQKLGKINQLGEGVPGNRPALIAKVRSGMGEVFCVIAKLEKGERGKGVGA